MAATIYSYNSNNRWCTYTLTMARDSNDNSKVVITASGSINTSKTSGGDSGGTVYAQLRYGVSPAQTSTDPAKNSTAANTYVKDYGTLITSTEGTTIDKGWTIKSKVTKSGSTTTYDNATVLVNPVDGSSSPSNPYTFTITWTKTTNSAISLSNVALFFFKNATSTSTPSNGAYAFIGQKVDLNANYSRYYTQSLSVAVGYTACGAPTSVTTSVPLQKPSGSVVIKWSGATAGTSNTITGYQIYYGTSSNPTTLLTTVSSTNNSGSYTYTIPSGASRGATYYFRVKTMGSAGSGYYSGYSNNQPTCKINTLPTLSSCSANKSIIARNSDTSVTFTLSGAANDGTLSFRYATSNSTSNTTAITSGTSLSIAAGTSNVTYYFWAYDELEYSASQSITLTRNTVPTAPTVSATKTVVKSSGDNVTFTLSGSTAGDTGQTISYRYATSASGEKKSFTNGNALPVTNTITYYFWAYDGLDFSASSSKTITVNTPPTYSNTSMSGGTLQNSQLLSSAQNTIFRLNDTASLIASTSTGGTLTYQWYYQMSDLSGDAAIGNTSATWNVISGATSSSCSTNNNIFKIRGKIYRLICRITDSLGDYTDVKFVWRIVAPIPTIMMVGNAGSASSPSYVDNQSDSESFKDTLIFNVSYDDSLSGVISSSSISSGSITGNEVVYNETTHNIKFTTSNIQKNTSYTISFIMAGKTGAPPAEISKTLSTAADPVGLTLEQTYSTNPFKPFSGGSNKYSFNLNGVNQTNYNFSNNAVTTIVLKYGNNTKSINFIQDSSTISGNYIILKFTQNQILDTNFIPETNWNTNQTITINSITMNDIFGFSHTINFTSNNSISVTFQEGIIQGQTSINGINGKTSPGTYYDIYEGKNNININLTCKAYNTEQEVTARLFIYRGNENTNIANILDTDWIAYPTSGNSTTFITGANRENYITSTTTTISYNVDPVTESKYIYFRLGLTLNGDTKYIIYNSSVTKHVSVEQIAPNNISLIDNSGNDKTNLSLQISTANSGVYPISNEAGITYKLSLQFCDEPTFTTGVKYLNIENGIGSLTTTEIFLYNANSVPTMPYSINFVASDAQGSGFKNWERYYVRIVYTTISSSYVPNSNTQHVSYIGYNNTILTLYNLVPTIAYRKNRLGINTRYVDGTTGQTYDQGDIIIGAMNNNSYLYIVQGDDMPHASINLTTGNLEGFKVNNGNIMSSNTSSRIFVQSSQPSSGMSTGDIWIDISNLT